VCTYITVLSSLYQAEHTDVVRPTAETASLRIHWTDQAADYTISHVETGEKKSVMLMNMVPIAF